jgi:hypothetical protein
MVNFKLMTDHVFILHRHVKATQTILMVLKTLILKLAVPMANLTVVMDLVSMLHGHATDTVTVLTVQTKLIAAK